MDMNNPTEHAEPNAESDGSVSAAKEQIVSFLAGQDSDVEKMSEAVKILASKAPDELALLRKKVMGEPQDELCDQISECLPEFIRLTEAEAAARMPEVFFHVEICHRCSSDASVLKDLAGERDDWLKLSRQLREAAQPNLLVLFKQGWKWATEKLDTSADLSKADVSTGRRVGAFLLRPALAADSIHFASSDEPALSLTFPYSSGKPQFDLHIIPEHQAFKNKYIWNVRVEMNPNTSVGVAQVGIGYKDQQVFGKRELRLGRNIEFKLEPPTQENYWLHMQWQSERGEWQEDKVELLLRAE